ncbi:MAG: hypothetical protein IAA85_01255 [Firmicutes bacterium]|nr:hypothetical protein [Candidatus Alectryobacillus merdavium]
MENNVGLIFAIITIVFVIGVTIFIIVKPIIDSKKRLTKKTLEAKKLNLDQKLEKRDILFSSLGGEENVIKIEYKEEYLIAYLRDIKIINLDLLKDFSLLKSEIKDSSVFLYFKDNKKEYDDLFGI